MRPATSRDSLVATVSLDVDYMRGAMDLVGTATARVLPLSVTTSPDGYDPDGDAVHSVEEVGLEEAVEFAASHAAQVDIELELLGTFYIGKPPHDGARPWPPARPIRLRPMSLMAPWRSKDAESLRLDWAGIATLAPASVTAEALPALMDALKAEAERIGARLDARSMEGYLAAVEAAPEGPDGSRFVYTPHNPVVELELPVAGCAYQTALKAVAEGLQLPRGWKVGKVDAEPLGPGHQGFEHALERGQSLGLAMPAVDLATGEVIPTGEQVEVRGHMTQWARRPRLLVGTADGRTAVATQSQLVPL